MNGNTTYVQACLDVHIIRRDPAIAQARRHMHHPTELLSVVIQADDGYAYV